MIKLLFIVLSGTSTLCCSYECYIVVVDERPVDSTSYYTLREKIQSAIQSEKNSTGVVLLTLDKDRFYLINDCFNPPNFTSEMLYRRASSAVQRITVDTNITSCKFCLVSFILFVAHLKPCTNRVLANLIGCYDGMNTYIYSRYVYEISIGNLQTNGTVDNYPNCAIKQNVYFSSNQEFKVTFSTLKKLTMKWGTSGIRRIPFEMESDTKLSQESNRKFVFLWDRFNENTLYWKTTCALYNMSLPAVGNIKELTKLIKAIQFPLSDLRSYKITSLYPNLDYVNPNHIDLICILQIKENVGQRYTWGGERETFCFLIGRLGNLDFPQAKIVYTGNSNIQMGNGLIKNGTVQTVIIKESLWQNCVK